MTEHEKTLRAAEKAEEILGFYVHAFIFAIVCTALTAVNYFVTDDVWWVQWVFLGWGIGVLAHLVGVFGRMPDYLDRWKAAKIRELRANM